MKTLGFCPNLETRLAAWQAFHRADAGTLLVVDSIASLPLPSAFPLTQWGFPSIAGRDAYLDVCVNRLEAFCLHRLRIGLEDALIPSLAPFYGTPEFDGFLPGDVRVFPDGAWHQGYLPTLRDFAFPLNAEQPWYAMTIGGMEQLAARARGRFAVRQRGFYSPLDLVRSMRDNEILMDFYDDPETLHQALAYAVTATNWWIEQQNTAADRCGEGTLAGFGVWLPGRGAGHFSEDTSAQISPATYAEFGLPYTSSVARGLDSIFIHTHPAGEHNFQHVVKVPNLRVLDIYNDPNYPRGMIMLQRYADTLFQGLAVELYPSREEILANADLLRRSKTILRYDAATDQDALEMADFVRELNAKAAR